MKKLLICKIIGILLTFILCFFLHFAYQNFPNFLFSILTPVNESIWEHMKLIATSFIIISLIEYLLIHKKIHLKNFTLNLFIVPSLGIITYLIIYLPIFLIVGENIYISLALLFLIIILMQILSYFILQYPTIKGEEKVGLIGLFILYFLFFYFTYFPPHNFLFYDLVKTSYGIIH